MPEDITIFKVVPEKAISGMKVYILGIGLDSHCTVKINGNSVATSLELEGLAVSFIMPPGFIFGNLTVAKNVVGGYTESNDLKITQIFQWSDPVLTSAQIVKGLYIDELRGCLSGKLTVAGKPSMKFKYPSPLSGKPLKWSRIIYELRYAINRFITPAITFTDRDLNNIHPKTVHIRELRRAVNDLNYSQALVNPLDQNVLQQFLDTYGYAISNAEKLVQLDPLYEAYIASIQI